MPYIDTNPAGFFQDSLNFFHYFETFLGDSFRIFLGFLKILAILTGFYEEFRGFFQDSFTILWSLWIFGYWIRILRGNFGGDPWQDPAPSSAPPGSFYGFLMDLSLQFRDPSGRKTAICRQPHRPRPSGRMQPMRIAEPLRRIVSRKKWPPGGSKVIRMDPSARSKDRKRIPVGSCRILSGLAWRCFKHTLSGFKPQSKILGGFLEDSQQFQGSIQDSYEIIEDSEPQSGIHSEFKPQSKTLMRFLRDSEPQSKILRQFLRDSRWYKASIQDSWGIHSHSKPQSKFLTRFFKILDDSKPQSKILSMFLSNSRWFRASIQSPRSSSTTSRASISTGKKKSVSLGFIPTNPKPSSKKKIKLNKSSRFFSCHVKDS